MQTQAAPQSYIWGTPNFPAPPTMDLKEFVIANVDATQYYQEKYPHWNPRSRPNVLCAFHNERKPSMSVGLEKGGARCHSCGKRIGNVVHFEASITGLSETDAARVLYDRYVHRIYPAKEIKRVREAVNPLVLGWIEKDTGIEQETVEAYGLGWDKKINRVVIPIQDRFGQITNVRNYCLPRHRTKHTKAKIYNADGYGYLELFPWQDVDTFSPAKPVFWMKAERDTMLARQMGLQAFCYTNGENTAVEEILEIFSDYDIIIVPDNDEPGQKAAKKRFDLLQTHKKFCCILDLPFSRISTKLKDFSDWVLLEGGDKQTLMNLYRDAKAAHGESKKQPRNTKSNGHLSLPEEFSTEFYELVDIGRRPDMLNRVVHVRALVAAKSDRPYSIPYKFLIKNKGMPTREWEVPVGRELLRLTKSTDDTILNFIKRDLLGNPKCNLEPLEYISVTEVELIPVVSPDKDSPYVTQRAYFFGENIEANLPYEMDIIPTNEVRSQEAVGIVVDVRPIARTLDTINYTPEEWAELESFRPEDDITEKLYLIANDFAMSYSGIYHREDWHIAALLSWFSPLQFIFPNEGLQRGWLNTLVVGDTQTGKSEVVEAIQEVTNGGTYVNAENCTYVGLVGGAVKGAGDKFMLRWGKIPLNNRQLVIIEELSGLSVTEIGNMSEVRSSGIARLDKGGLSSQTNAKTRLVCLSNVRGKNRNLSSYISGVQAIQELIGQPEDISRFDLVVTLTDREVSADIINQPRFSHKGMSEFGREAFRNLLRFTWSLTPEQIHITEDAYLTCLTKTKEMAKMYHPSIPLFKSGSGRLKLARIACAIACLQFAWDGKQIVVTADHVLAAVDLLQTLYDKESCGYLEYSKQMFYRESLQCEPELNREVEQVISQPDRRVQLLRYLLNTGRFTQDELMQVAGLAQYQASKIIGRMVNSNVVVKREKNVWDIAPVGKPWLIKKIEEYSKSKPKVQRITPRAKGSFGAKFHSNT